MTFGDLKQMLATDVNRADKETLWYPIWINRALRRIQTKESWACMRTRPSVTILVGDSSTELPAGFKELTPEPHPVVFVDPSTPGVSGETPCEVTSREDLSVHRASILLPAPSRPGLRALPVFLELDNGVWTLNLADPASDSLTFKVSHYGFLPELASDSDTNWFLQNYPELVESTVKAIAFAAINDPIAATFEGMASTQLAEARTDDFRRRTRGRALRMGG